MTSLVRAHFDRELLQLHQAVLELGSRARQLVEAGLRALLDNNADLAAEVIAGDALVNELRYRIEKQCYGLLATEQPVAGDLRAIVAALTITSELERIGDHGKRIAKICMRMSGEPRSIPLAGLADLGANALQLVDRALAAYASRDVAAARAVCSDDDKVDARYKQGFNVTLSYMLENRRAIGAGTYLIQAAHELERVADRATNVAERVIYAETGILIELNV